MAQAARDTRLPEPTHPFSRWFGGASAAIWAVGVQSLPDPWNKLMAILTPGFGYIAGHSLDLGSRWYDQGRAQRILRKEEQNVRETIKKISEEISSMRNNGEAQEAIEPYEEVLIKARSRLREVLASSISAAT